MNADSPYITKLIATWEEVYKKGQLSLWILLALRDRRRYIEEIRQFIDETAPTFSCEKQSLYRALRRFYDLEMVDYVARKGHRGPDRKYYCLTDLGRAVLREFIRRNITFLYADRVTQLIVEASK